MVYILSTHTCTYGDLEMGYTFPVVTYDGVCGQGSQKVTHEGTKNVSVVCCDPRDCSPPGSSVHGISQARGLEWAATPSSRGPSQPRDEPRDPALQADSLPSEPPGKPHNRSTLSYCRTASGNLRSGKITEGRRTGTEPALRPVLGKGEQAEAEPGLD